MNKQPYTFKLKATSPEGIKHFDATCYCGCGEESANWQDHHIDCDVFYFKAVLARDKPAMRYAG